MDISQMSPSELDEYLSGLSDKELNDITLGSAMQASQPRQSQPPTVTPPQNPTSGMSGPELFMAGMGQRAMQIPRGLKELGIGAFGSDAEMAEYSREKAATRELDKPLLNTWQGKAGGLGTDVATSMMIPARMAAQVGGAGLGAMVRPTEGDIHGLEIPTRMLNGAAAAGTTAAVAAPLQAIGRSIGAATKRYTPEGQEALRLNDAANRLGVTRNTGGLDPSSSLNAFETNLPGYARTVEDQVKAFSKSADVVKDIPSKSGRSYESRQLGGENLRAAIQEAGQNLEGVGGSLWKDLDSFIVQNNIAPVGAKNTAIRVNELIQKYTPIGRKGMQLDKNPALQRISEYDPDSAQLMTQLLANPGKVPQVPFSDLHKLSSAVGKAMGRAEKDAAAPGASLLDRQMKRELKDLYGSLMSDVDSWGTKSPQAKQMFDEARSFWRDAVVPGALTNKVYSKASKGVYGMNPRGYSEPSQLYSDVVKNPRAIQDLYPYMPQKGRDLSDTLQSMPDVSRALTTNTPHPPAPGMGTLTTMAGMAVGSPLQLMKGAISHAPGFQKLANSDAAKRLYFARDTLHGTPAGRVAFGASQYPQEKLEGGLKRFLGQHRP